MRSLEAACHFCRCIASSLGMRARSAISCTGAASTSPRRAGTRRSRLVPSARLCSSSSTRRCASCARWTKGSFATRRSKFVPLAPYPASTSNADNKSHERMFPALLQKLGLPNAVHFQGISCVNPDGSDRKARAGGAPAPPPATELRAALSTARSRQRKSTGSMSSWPAIPMSSPIGGNSGGGTAVSPISRKGLAPVLSGFLKRKLHSAFPYPVQALASTNHADKVWGASSEEKRGAVCSPGRTFQRGFQHCRRPRRLP